MKHVIYKNRTSQRYHRKIVSINEFNQDNQLKTHVQKSFLYHVVSIMNQDVSDHAPEIYIQKHIDTKNQTEEFCFRVRGSFVTMALKGLVRVEFSHRLKINAEWNDKNFSPKKSVTLT
ncbi:MAG: hypothetical protein AB1650_01300 [Candidatus Omnitrophota bacterium]